jgi:hypothetical protein
VQVASEFDFDLQHLEVEVLFRYEGQDYVLVVAREGDAIAFRDAAIRALKSLASDKGDGTGTGSLTSLLLAMCVKKVLADGDRQKVGQETIKSWPSPMTRKLFEKAKEISDLRETPDSKESLDAEQRSLDARRKALNGEAAKN